MSAPGRSQSVLLPVKPSRHLWERTTPATMRRNTLSTRMEQR
jgi:hypothetical protein